MCKAELGTSFVAISPSLCNQLDQSIYRSATAKKAIQPGTAVINEHPAQEHVPVLGVTTLEMNVVNSVRPIQSPFEVQLRLELHHVFVRQGIQDGLPPGRLEHLFTYLSFRLQNGVLK